MLRTRQGLNLLASSKQTTLRDVTLNGAATPNSAFLYVRYRESRGGCAAYIPDDDFCLTTVYIELPIEFLRGSSFLAPKNSTCPMHVDLPRIIPL